MKTQTKQSVLLRAVGLAMLVATVVSPIFDARGSSLAGVGSEPEPEPRSVPDLHIQGDGLPSLHARVDGCTVSLGEGDLIVDVFPEDTRLAEVIVTIEAPASGEAFVVQTLTGPTWQPRSDGNWEAVFPMPAAGECSSGSFALALVDGELYDPVFEVKRRRDGEEPDCS
jgi:hypothetical protein